MLNKDQYNQDEYNNYYKQETESAEIKGFDAEEGGLGKKLIPIFGLTALGLAGYFGYKTFSENGTNQIGTEKIVIKEEATKSSNSSIEEKVIKTIKENKAKTASTLIAEATSSEKKLEKTIEEKVASKVQEQITNTQNMSGEDISKIVNIVMSKMEKEKRDTKKVDKDDALLNALENTDTESSTIASRKTEKTIATTTSAKIEKAENDNSYNKITLDNNSKKEENELDALSEQIKKLLNIVGESSQPYKNKKSTLVQGEKASEIIETNSSTDTSSYEESISQEIQVRSNEMRIIIVKAGDTLNKIAKRAYGDASAYQKIFDANPEILNHADKIYVGQKLRIPQ